MASQNGINHLHIYICRIQEQAIREGAESDAFSILDEYGLELAEHIGPFVPLLTYYILLIDREQFQFNPFEAYNYGKYGRQAGISYHDTYWSYLNDQHELPESRKRETAMLNLYSIISSLLDKEHRYLLDYLTEEYRAVYGAINRNILEIIKMGYDVDNHCKSR